MKRQKRNLQTRAYQRGYIAGLDGRHQDMCPHVENNMRSQWLAGWREGRVDNWDGLNRVTAMHKMASQ